MIRIRFSKFVPPLPLVKIISSDPVNFFPSFRYQGSRHRVAIHFPSHSPPLQFPLPPIPIFFSRFPRHIFIHTHTKTHIRHLKEDTRIGKIKKSGLVSVLKILTSPRLRGLFFLDGCQDCSISSFLWRKLLGLCESLLGGQRVAGRRTEGSSTP